MTIDPEQLHKLAQSRLEGGDVRISWSTMRRVIAEMRRLQGYVSKPRQAAALREYAHSLHPDHGCRDHLLREAARLTREAEGIRQ